MALLEPEGEDAEPRQLYYAPLTFLSHVGSHSIEWPLDVWQTFFSSSLGVSVPILVNHPRTLCACKKHLLGHLPDHVHCCQSVAASTQAHDWAVTQLKPLFGSLGHEVRVQTAVTASMGKQRGDVQIREFLHNSQIFGKHFVKLFRVGRPFTILTSLARAALLHHDAARLGLNDTLHCIHERCFVARNPLLNHRKPVPPHLQGCTLFQIVQM